MTDARGWTLVALTVAGWLMPQASVEEWAVKAGLLTSVLVGLAAWSVWRGGRRELIVPAAVCACWGAATVPWSLDPVRSAAGALAIGSLLLIAAGGIRISSQAVQALIVAAAVAEAGFVIVRQGSLPRASGTFINATHFAAVAAIGAAAVMPDAIWARGRRRAMALGLLALVSFGVARSGSRAGLIALACGLVAARLVDGGWKRRAPWRVAITWAVVAAAVMLPSGVFDRLSAQAAGGEVSAWDRLAIWKTSAVIAVRHPLGVGLGAFGDAFAPVSPRPGVTTDYAHSEPLQWLVEAGWPGLLLLGWLVAALRRVIRVRDEHDAAAASALAALGVFVLLDFPLHVPYLALAGTGLAISLLPPPGSVANTRPLTGLLVAATAAAAMIWLGGLAVAEHSYARGYRMFATDPAAAVAKWEQAVAACPEYSPPRIALDVLRREARR